MKSFQYTVTDPVGIHARPAGDLVKAVSQFASTVTIDKEGKTADAKRLMAVMALGVKQGMTITVTVEGDDEDAAASSIEQFFKDNL